MNVFFPLWYSQVLLQSDKRLSNVSFSHHCHEPENNNVLKASFSHSGAVSYWSVSSGDLPPASFSHFSMGRMVRYFVLSTLLGAEHLHTPP